LRDSDKLDLPVDGREKEIKVTDISPLSKSRHKPATKTGRKGDRSEEITGSPFKAALEIKNSLKNKVKTRAKEAFSLVKSSRTQLRRDVQENSIQNDDEEIFFNQS
jgi:hypothetical protein